MNETTNEIFAKMLDWLYVNKKASSQREVAEKAGIDPVTTSRILNGRVKKAKLETLRKVNEAYGNVFNNEWIRGKSDVMLAHPEENVCVDMHGLAPGMPDMSSMTNAIIAGRDEAIMALKGQLASKDETIEALKGRMEEKERLISHLEQQLMELRMEKGLHHFAPGVAEEQRNQPKV